MERSLTLCMTLALAQLTSAQGWTFLDTTNTPLERNTVSFLAFAGNGDLWTANEGNGQEGMGLYRFDGELWTRYDEDDCPALTNGVRCAAADAAGNMWFGVYQKGLVKYDGTDWTVYNPGNSGILGDIVVAIEVDGNGAPWVATWTGGLSRFDGTTWTNWNAGNAPFVPEYQCITSLEFYGGKVWVGLECDGGLACYDPDTEDWTMIPGLPHGYISALLNDGQGNLWVGYTYWGNMVSHFDGTTWTHDYFPGVYYSVAYNSLAVDLEGMVWSSAMGLWYFIDGEWVLHGAPLPPDGAGSPNQNIAIGPDGSLWWAEYNGIWTDHQFQTTVGIGEPGSASNTLMVHPTPASQRVTITLPTGMASATVRLFDTHGALVRQLRTHDGAQVVIERDGLAAGAYSAIVIGDNGAQAKGRLIFE